MKRIIISFVVIVLMFSVASVTTAATKGMYQVVRGDSLSVIGNRLGVKWKDIVKLNNIKNPNLIFPGQELLIPRTEMIKRWKKVGGNPYKGSPKWAIDNFNLPDDVKSRVNKNIKNDKFKWFILKSGRELEQLTFGKKRVNTKIVCSWDKTKLYAAKDYGFNNYHVIHVLKCGNWAWFKTETLHSEKVLPEVPIFSKGEDKGLPPVPVFSNLEERVANECGFDLYVGGGIYETDRWLNRKNKDYHHNGWYAWAKARYRPFGFELTERISACLGAFVFGAIGGGDDQEYDYGWNKWFIGPSLKLIGHKDHWDADFDLGLWGQLVSKGDVGLYNSKQVDNISVFSAHLNLYERRAENKKLGPKTELNLEFTLPHGSNHEHSWNGNNLDPDPHNNQVLEISLIQHIYDFEISDDFILTPGFNLGYVKEWGLEDSNFIQFGPRATMTWNNEDIVSISIFNYKENIGGDGDQWHWVSGHVSIYGLIKAYGISQITKPTNKELCFSCL